MRVASIDLRKLHYVGDCLPDLVGRPFDVAVSERSVIGVPECPNRRETTGTGTPFITAWLA